MPPIPRIDNPQPTPRTMYLGIDPGKAGGLVLLDRSKVELRQMPETERDLWNLFHQEGDGHGFGVELYSQKPARWDNTKAVTKHFCHPVVCCIEQVSTSPQMGVVSAGSFMYGYGRLKMALTAAKIPFEEIRPQVWQKALRIVPRKKTETQTAWKDRLRRKAQQLYPNLDIWQATLTDQRGIADALLIAHYCREKARGTLG